MFEAIKARLKRHEPFRTWSWIREQNRSDVDLGRFRQCGRNVRISAHVTISHRDMISIGDNVVIHRHVMINGGGGLVIGNNVGISYGTTIWTLDHTFQGGEALPFDRDVVMRPILINDNVAIGANVSVTPGLEIGEGAIIGMGAVVTTDVKPLAVMFGNPARVVGFRDREEYEQLKAAGRFFDFGQRHRPNTRIVPQYIQQRPNLFAIVRGEVEAGRAVLEEAPEIEPV